MQIKTINTYRPALCHENKEGDPKKQTIKFDNLLKDALDKVNQLQLDKEEYKKLLITGELDNLHDVTIAAEKANVALQLTLGIRNKVVEAYKEIMRMQI